VTAKTSLQGVTWRGMPSEATHLVVVYQLIHATRAEGCTHYVSDRCAGVNVADKVWRSLTGVCAFFQQDNLRGLHSPHSLTTCIKNFHLLGEFWQTARVILMHLPSTAVVLPRPRTIGPLAADAALKGQGSAQYRHLYHTHHHMRHGGNTLATNR
jgi:hypothetical protein